MWHTHTKLVKRYCATVTRLKRFQLNYIHRNKSNRFDLDIYHYPLKSNKEKKEKKKNFSVCVDWPWKCRVGLPFFSLFHLVCFLTPTAKRCEPCYRYFAPGIQAHAEKTERDWYDAWKMSKFFKNSNDQPRETLAI